LIFDFKGLISAPSMCSVRATEYHSRTKQVLAPSHAHCMNYAHRTNTRSKRSYQSEDTVSLAGNCENDAGTSAIQSVTSSGRPPGICDDRRRRWTPVVWRFVV
jgi:hypothetical protein